MATTDNRPYPLIASIKNFAWGKAEKDSLVFKLANDNTQQLFPRSPTGTDATNTPETPYSELWLGTHATGPALVLPRAEDRTVIDPENVKQLPTLQSTLNNVDLPYLFKILSIKEALSIQSHPDKKLAEKLHAERPDVYKDPNHKPELVVALTQMRALCGFRPVAQIVENIKKFNNAQFTTLLTSTAPLLAQYDASLKTEYTTAHNDQLLRQIWAAFYAITEEQGAQIIQDFRQQYSSLDGVYQRQLLDNDASYVSDFEQGILALCYELSNLYPRDIAVFSPFFLHYFALQPGESIFLGPNIPHAYLFGDCVEVMSNSDNVIRAGLTPKYKDVPVLLSSLTYQQSPAPLIDTGLRIGSDPGVYHTVYQPPVGEFTEFMVVETKLIKNSLNNNNNNNNNNKAITLPTLPSKSLLLNVTGEGVVFVEYLTESGEKQTYQQALAPGGCLYIPEKSAVSVAPHTNMLFYRSCANFDAAHAKL